MFKYKEFKAQKNFKNKSWYIVRLILQCAILVFIPVAINSFIPIVVPRIWSVCGFIKFWDLTTDLDKKIPLVKPFVIIYLLAIPWWYVAPFLIYLVQGKRNFYRYIICELTCEVIGILFLIILPTNCAEFKQRSVTLCNSDSILDRMLRGVYHFSYGCEFPSFHIINSWTIFAIAREKDENNKRHWIFGSICAVIAIIISLSTLFIQQHWIVDIFFAIVIVELVFAIYKLHIKQYALQTFMTWLNTGTKLEPIYLHKNIDNYRLVSKDKRKQYVVLYISLFTISICIVAFSGIIYFLI